MYMYIFIHLILCLSCWLVGGGEAFSITFFQLSLLTLLGIHLEAYIFIIYCVIFNISCKMYQCLRLKTSELKDGEKKPGHAYLIKNTSIYRIILIDY